MRSALSFMTWGLVLAWFFTAMTLFGLTVASGFDTGMSRAVWEGSSGMPVAVPMLGALFVLTVLIGSLFRIGARYPSEPRTSHRAPYRPRHAPRQATEADEARFLQEFQASLARMEQRIEALETLLLDRAPARGQRL